MKVALVVDHLKEYGGAERWVEAMKEAWPNAPIYTSIVQYDRLPAPFRQFDIRPSFLQKIRPFFPEQALIPLMPVAFATFNFDAYDIVLSSHAFFATSIITRPGTRHICYCHTPPRFLWGYPTDRAWQDWALVKILLAPITGVLRTYDYYAAQRVDRFVTNSENVRRRIQKFYRRDATVVHCGYDITKTQNAKLKTLFGSFSLVVSRLVYYKNVHLAVEACNRLEKNLVIVGEGPEERRLHAMAGPTVRLVGRVRDDVLCALYRQCTAVIFPAEDDFGNVPVEAMLAGKPVLALKKGGAKETVVVGKTGAFFDEPTTDSLSAALVAFDPSAYDPVNCVRRAKQFSKRQFLKRMREIVTETT